MLFRKTDGYTEVSAVPQGDIVELYVTYPGETEEVLHAHFSARLAWRLGVWLLWYWMSDRLFGLSRKKYLEKLRTKLFTGADAERVPD
jgi:hypothetical protein